MKVRALGLVALAVWAGVGCSSSPAMPSGATGSGGTTASGGTTTSGGAKTTGGAGGSGTTPVSGSAGTTAGDANGGAPPAGDGIVTGAEDTHCANRPMGISDPAVCDGAPIGGGRATGGAGGGGAGGTSSAEHGGGGMAAVTDCNLVHDSGYGDTLFNTSGDDDECKYHMTWTSTPVRLNEPFTLTVVAFDIATGKPLETIAPQKPGTPALSRIEPYMPCDISHQPPSADYTATVTEIGPGKFTVGPVVFDKSGRWVVRYHYYEECLNSETTPHAHIAFFIDVP